MRAISPLKIFLFVLVTFLFLIATSVPQDTLHNRQFNLNQQFTPPSNERNRFRAPPPQPFSAASVSSSSSSSSEQSNNYRGVSCGYESCPSAHPTALNVHIVCHTHLDTGWVETYDEYYFRYVKTIYDSVTATLSEKPNRKFIVVETSFFSRWFKELSESSKKRVIWLVKSGQLEFISGGWSMNDEASTYYQDIIDQMTYGHNWLNQTFGSCARPKIGWQIDPFGHSREQASIMSQMGFDGLFLGRIDYQDKELRERTQTLEMVWKSSPSLGAKGDLFTGVLPNVYWPPKGFCFDANCWDEPIHDQNVLSKTREFINHVKQQAANYNTSHTIITMGMDFYFRDADKWFRNLDKLIASVNALTATQGVHMMYSTPGCYLKSLHELNKRWPTKLDDFFPYADAFNTYWTGYFTTRPSLKYHIRVANNVLQAAKQLQALTHGLNERTWFKLKPLQEVLGIMQHHDAVTGTCKQYVSNDYTSMMAKAIQVAEESIVESYDRMWIKEGFSPLSSNHGGSGPVTFCSQLNSSICEVTQFLSPSSDVTIIIYNPVAHPVKHYVRLPVRASPSSGFRVRDALGSVSASQVVPNHEAVSNLPERNRTPSDSELVFRVMLPPLGFTSIAVDTSTPPSTNNHLSQVIDGSMLNEEVTISNSRLSVAIDPKTGLMTAVTLKDGSRVPISQNFFIYDAEGRKMGEKPSGAYAFNPSPYKPRPASSKVAFKVVKGPLVEEIHQTFNSWISQVIRIYQHVDYIEFDWIVGPIPIDNWFFDPGQEIISKFDTFLATNGTFFTDSNGRETIRRVRDHRPTWNLDTTENVASNYYPVTSWAFIRDYEKDLQLTVMPDRPEGGSSLADGSLELMVHRRLTMDDGFGVDEALNEPGVDGRGLIVRGKHRVVIGDIQESIRQMRMMSKSLSLRPIMAFRKRDLSVYNHNLRAAFNPNGINQYSPGSSPRAALSSSKFIGVNRKLPPNINLLTLEPWQDERILIRLEHIFEVNEDPKYSRPRRVSLRDLFTPFVVTEASEMTLSATAERRVVEATRFRWFPNVDPYANYSNVLTQLDSEDLESDGLSGDNPLYVTLFPMEIRTFLVRTRERTNCTYTGSNIFSPGSMPNGNRNNWRRTPNC